MGVKLVSSSGGSVELNAPVTASNYTMTVPANNGTVITTASTFAGTGPAFSAYMGANQTINSATFTKANYNTEFFDTNSCYDAANSRFTPNVAGYYQFSAVVSFSSSFTGVYGVALGINGSSRTYDGNFITQTSTGANVTLSVIAYLNGSTDYAQLYVYQSTGVAVTLSTNSNNSFFCGALVRAA